MDEDKRSKLAALAAKRRDNADADNNGVSKHASSSSPLLLDRLKESKPTAKGDGFLVDSDEEGEEPEASGRDGDYLGRVVDAEEEDSEDESFQDKGKKRAKPPTKGRREESSKQSKKKKKKDDDDDESEFSAAEDDFDVIDTTNIISTGRRTRGKKIDYTQFGPDESEEEDE
jgi:hypothetical protein